MVRRIFNSGSLASPARIIWRFHSRIRSSKKRGPLPRQRPQRRLNKAALEYITERNSKRDRLPDIPFHRLWRAGGRRRTHVRWFASRRSAKPFDCKQWDGKPGLANYTRATTSPGAAPTRHPAHNFVCCDHPSTCSRLRTMNKRNTLVGPQLQRGRTGFYSGLETVDSLPGGDCVSMRARPG